jgi:hypothetical protein
MHLNRGALTQSGTGLALAIVALAAGGCGGKVTPVTDESDLEQRSAHAGRSLGSVDVSPPADDASTQGTLPIAQAVDAGGSSSPTTTPAQAGACDDSTYRRVAFEITNTGTTDVYLAALGRGCTTYSIDGIDGESVPQLVWGGVACDADPDWGYADTFQRLVPGATAEDNWFATRAVVNPSGCGSESCLVNPGRYRVTFAYELALPPECGGDLYCGTRPGLPGNPVYAPLCPTSRTTTQEFVLPPQTGMEAGEDITVAVSLNPGQ